MMSEKGGRQGEGGGGKQGIGQQFWWLGLRQ